MFHVVAEDESLWKIAASRLGSGERWNEIAKLNPTIDPDRLKVGQRLQLPAGAGPASTSAPSKAVASVDEAPAPQRRVR